jgi:nucleotide-binding universal stress UspA family protein
VTIVVGYVPSAEGRAALRRAIAEARLRGTDLLVLNTVRNAVDDPGYASVQELELVRSELAASGVRHELRQVARRAEPAEEIVEVAAEVGAQLIVIGLRRRSAVGKFLTGSTAQRILLDAGCAVLAVKADDRPADPPGRPGPPSATRSGAAGAPPSRTAAAPPPDRSPRSAPGTGGR